MLAMRRSVDLQLRPITGGQRPGAVQTTDDLSAGKLSSQRWSSADQPAKLAQVGCNDQSGQLDTKPLPHEPVIQLRSSEPVWPASQPEVEHLACRDVA